jgi:hypothetical protein
MGTEPDKVTPERFFEIRHPDKADTFSAIGNLKLINFRQRV